MDRCPHRVLCVALLSTQTCEGPWPACSEDTVGLLTCLDREHQGQSTTWERKSSCIPGLPCRWALGALIVPPWHLAGVSQGSWRLTVAATLPFCVGSTQLSVWPRRDTSTDERTFDGTSET